MADGTILHQPTPDEPREASTGDNHQATNAAREIGPVDKVPFTIDHLLAHLPQRLVLRDLLRRVGAEIERLQDENEALRIDLAAAYCRMDDMEGLNDE